MDECKHSWCNSPNVFMTYPPKYDRICRLCGKEEHVVMGRANDSLEYEALKKLFRSRELVK